MELMNNQTNDLSVLKKSFGYLIMERNSKKEKKNNVCGYRVSRTKCFKRICNVLYTFFVQCLNCQQQKVVNQLHPSLW